MFQASEVHITRPTCRGVFRGEQRQHCPHPRPDFCGIIPQKNAQVKSYKKAKIGQNRLKLSKMLPIIQFLLSLSKMDKNIDNCPKSDLFFLTRSSTPLPKIYVPLSFSWYLISWYLRNRCVLKDQSLLSDLLRAFD